MSLVTRQTLLALTDKAGTFWDQFDGILGGANGIDTRATEFQKLIIGDGSASNPGSGNDDLIADLRAVASSLTGASTQAQLDAILMNDTVDAIDDHCNDLGSTVSAAIIGLDSFATYYNGIVPFDCLLCYQFAYIWTNCRGTYLTGTNVFSPQTNMGRYEFGVGFTDESSIPVGSASTQGYSAANIQGYVLNTITGTCAVTVTGTDQNGATQTWTGTASSLSAGATFVLTCGVVGKRCRNVTNITITGTMSAGQFRVRSIVERTIADTGVPMTRQIAHGYEEFAVTATTTDHKVTTGFECEHAMASPAQDSMGEDDVGGSYGWGEMKWLCYATNMQADGFDIRVVADQALLTALGGSLTVRVSYIAHSVE